MVKSRSVFSIPQKNPPLAPPRRGILEECLRKGLFVKTYGVRIFTMMQSQENPPSGGFPASGTGQISEKCGCILPCNFDDHFYDAFATSGQLLRQGLLQFGNRDYITVSKCLSLQFPACMYILNVKIPDIIR